MTVQGEKDGVETLKEVQFRLSKNIESALVILILGRTLTFALNFSISSMQRQSLMD